MLFIQLITFVKTEMTTFCVVIFEHIFIVLERPFYHVTVYPQKKLSLYDKCEQ